MAPIQTGSSSLYLRGLLPGFDDVDIIVTPEQLSTLEQTLRSRVTGIIPGTDGSPYELKIKINGVQYEIWRETGEGMPIPGIVSPRAADRIILPDGIQAARPLCLLLRDYERASISSYEFSRDKREAYVQTIARIREALQRPR